VNPNSRNVLLIAAQRLSTVPVRVMPVMVSKVRTHYGLATLGVKLSWHNTGFDGIALRLVGQSPWL
jgi:hypothetical protein